MAASETGRWWTYRREGNVGIWTIEDWEKLFEEEIEEAEAHYREATSRTGVTAALVVFDEVEALGSDMQEHMTETWSQLAQTADVERIGYVADGITAMAVRSNVRAPHTELGSFESLEEARSWAGQA